MAQSAFILFVFQDAAVATCRCELGVARVLMICEFCTNLTLNDINQAIGRDSEVRPAMWFDFDSDRRLLGQFDSLTANLPQEVVTKSQRVFDAEADGSSSESLAFFAAAFGADVRSLTALRP